MKYIGYHRTSTREQHLDRGIKEITDFCRKENINLHKDKVYTDQQTGKNFERPAYRLLKDDVLECGDTLIITEIDRLGRNKQGILKELQYFKENNIRVMVLELPTTLINFADMKGGNELAKMMLETINNILTELYASMAEAEMEKKEKRQKEGIQAMKDRGDWKKYGRPRSIEFKQFEEGYKRLLQGEIKPFALIKELNLNKSTYYRYKREYEQSKKDKSKEKRVNTIENDLEKWDNKVIEQEDEIIDF